MAAMKNEKFKANKCIGSALHMKRVCSVILMLIFGITQCYCNIQSSIVQRLDAHSEKYQIIVENTTDLIHPSASAATADNMRMYTEAERRFVYYYFRKQSTFFLRMFIVLCACLRFSTVQYESIVYCRLQAYGSSNVQTLSSRH